MAQKMPKELEEMLHQLDDPDEIKRIHGKWLELAAANENYERNYPIQFGNLVEANLKFKENKTIPTPTEQMRGYNDLIRNEISDSLEAKEVNSPEENVYELEDDQPSKEKTFEEFKLTFDDISYQEGEDKKELDKDDLEKTEMDRSFNFNLLIDNIDEVTRDAFSREDLDLDIDYE